MGEMLCAKCQNKKNRMMNYIIQKREIRLVTLGPMGTTSSVVASRLKKSIQNVIGEVKFIIDLYDSFELALNEIHNKRADMILIPNAYDKITQYYWDTTMELVYSFISETPIYGLATIGEKILKNGGNYSVVTCKAVEHLVDQLWKTTEYGDSEYHLVGANSTKKSLELLEDDKVDFALTNASSLEKSDAYFISETLSTEVLWSVFMMRQ